MEKKNQKIDRKRKALLVLPLLVIPFLTMAFWALGGGKGEADSQGTASGLNLQLPGAKLKETEGESKMSFYDRAEKDYAKRTERAKGNSALSLSFPGTDSSLSQLKDKTPLSYDPYPSTNGTYRDPNETKVYQKLAELNQQMSVSAKTYENRRPPIDASYAQRQEAPISDGEGRQLKREMENDGESASDDSDLHHLSSMMDKILDIQHPERVRERVGRTTVKGERANNVERQAPKLSSLSTLGLDTGRPASYIAFFSLDQSSLDKEENNAVEAVVHGLQTLVEGGTIKLRLLQDVRIDDQLIPKDNFVFGAVSLNGERLEVSISSIRVGSSLYGVNLHLFDMDGREGISIPGAITREVAKSSAENAAQMLEVTSLDPSLKAQATSAGLSAVKTLLSKKVKLVRVSVKGGYKVLLKNAGN